MATVSFLLLYLQLALIRWIPGFLHNFGYFASFVVLAAFLGLGAGCLLRRWRPLGILLPAVLFALITLVRGLEAQITLPEDPRAVFWSEPLAEGRTIPVTALVPVLFLAITLSFVSLGQYMGALFAALPRLRSYAWNIAGGLVGVLAFAANSHFSHPPLVWFSVIAALYLWLSVASAQPWRARLALLAALLGVLAWTAGSDRWSPYYRQGVKVGGEPGFYFLVGNGVPGIILGPVEAYLGWHMYNTPYHQGLGSRRKHGHEPYGKVLVIGCGGGNEVSMALRHGAQRVDAVDINPWVIEVGRAIHPDRPFDDPRVRTFVDDGRAFLRNSRERYDLIVYGLPDSTFSLDRTGLRVESFLFTVEAFREARAHLSERGVFVIYNFYRVTWLVQKLRNMMAAAFGQEPLVAFFPGPQVPAAVAAGPGLDLEAPRAIAEPGVATDDWPFLYLREAVVPRPYLAMLGLVALITVVVIGGALRLGASEHAPDPATRNFHAAMFFMGAAFVLLETRSLATFGLFFGTNWWTSVVVFAAIHVSILLAVLVAARFPALPAGLSGAALLGSLLLAWLLPQEGLLVSGFGWRAVLAGAVAFLPIFCANVLFARLFRDAAEGDTSMAFNLLGGMFGGLAEYLSLSIGFRALLLLAGLFYLIALAAARTSRRAAVAVSDASAA